MELLGEKELIWTSVVANSAMNRERNLMGINSYEKDLYFDIAGFIKQKINTNSDFAWIDLCCGEGKALFQAQELLSCFPSKSNISLEGIDLVDMFGRNHQEVKLQVGSLLEWEVDKKYDLISCVHGLHYIGDKLEVIRRALQNLRQEGIFVANLDLDAIRNPNNQSFKKELLQDLKRQGIAYKARQKVLICEGYRKLELPYQYLGADIEAGKNYTGQEAVNSIYLPRRK